MKLPLLTLGKTVFVTLLMIGIAMTGCGQSKPKIAIPAGQFDAATFKGPWPTKKVDCIDLGSNYFNVHYQDGTELHFADSRPNRDVPPIPDPLPPDVDNADLCSELHADKAAKPPAKKVVWSALSQAKPVIKMCSGLTGECDPTALDGLNTFNACRDQKWIGMAKWRGKDVRCAELGDAVKASDLADMIPDTAPLDVPAIRKTRVIHPKGTCWGEGQNAVCAPQKDDTEDYWDCEDPDAYSLQISVSGKAANCHRIVP